MSLLMSSDMLITKLYALEYRVGIGLKNCGPVCTLSLVTAKVLLTKQSLQIGLVCEA